MKLQKGLNRFNVAAYIRLSREDGDKEESDSVGNQRKLLTEYINNKEDLMLYDSYIDDGYTGTNFNRPNFQRMVADMETGKVNCVIVKDLSRFGRDYIETGRYLERVFPEQDIRFISITDGIDSINQTYDMLLPIKNIFNEQYARDISNKIQATVKSKQKAGDFIGAFTSYGYKKSPVNKNKLIIDEYASEVVRRIFSLYLQGYGKQRIAKVLNEEEVLCPAEYKKAMGLNYHNPNRLESTTYWSYSTINSILHREMYIGNMVQGTKHQRMRSKQKKMDKNSWIVVENTHDAIIDKETWEKAQCLLQKRTRELGMKTNQNIFAGFVKCADCGRAMVKNMRRHSDGIQTYTLYCGTYKRNGKQYCTPHMFPMKALEEIILSDLKTLIQNVAHLKELVQKQQLLSTRIKKVTDTELNKMRTELEHVKKLKQSVYEDYREELITKEEFLFYRKDYLKKEELYSKQMKVLEEKKKESTIEDVFETPWLKQILEQKEIEALDRETMVEMINEIKIYNNRKIKIIYNFTEELGTLFSSVYSADTEENII